MKVKIIILAMLLLGQVTLMYGFTQTNSVILSLSLYNSDKLSVANIGGSTITYGTFKKNTTNFNTGPQGGTNERAIFKNDGTGAQDYQLRGVITSGSITLLTNGGLGNPIPSTDELRILAMFQQWDSTFLYSPTDFLADDTLTTNFRTADVNVFAKTSDAENNKGYNVPASGERSVRFCFEPGPVTIEGNKSVTIYIKALQH